LEAKKIEAEYAASHPPVPVPTVPAGASPIPEKETTAPPDAFKEFGGQAYPALFVLWGAEDRYNQLVKKADSEKVPDPDTSYFPNFPLCKDIR